MSYKHETVGDAQLELILFLRSRRLGPTDAFSISDATPPISPPPSTKRKLKKKYSRNFALLNGDNHLVSIYLRQAASVEIKIRVFCNWWAIRRRPP